ncbi:hypothetical protein L7F22_047187 [Adiantum nelumboides]|nr:hypothetical protein [Adiantum nelumboides]
MPRLGFGVSESRDAHAAVAEALAQGYRSIDTAAVYENETGVGAALAGSGLPRSELFVTTKVWNVDGDRPDALGAARRSLDRLGLDHVDLLLVHWPNDDLGHCLSTWEAMEQLLAEGRTRAVGVFELPTVAPAQAPLARRSAPGAQPGRAAPAPPAAGAARGARRAGHRHRRLEPAGPRRGPRRAGPGPDRRPARRHPRPGGPALAPAAGHRRRSEVRRRGAHRRQPRSRRVHPRRGRPRPPSPRCTGPTDGAGSARCPTGWTASRPE